MVDDFRLPREQRLAEREAFDKAFALRASASDERLIVYAVPNGLAYCRLGLRVGRRYGNAVRRNRLKRLLREAFRLNRHLWPTGWDLVVTPRPVEPVRKPSKSGGGGKAAAAKAGRPTAASNAGGTEQLGRAGRITLTQVAESMRDLSPAAIRRAQRKTAAEGRPNPS
jgi:ribonuclease P protein component